MICCQRCRKIAPLPSHIHANYDGVPGGDPELPVLFPVPRDWCPTEDEDGIVCPSCATDAELVEWHWRGEP